VKISFCILALMLCLSGHAQTLRIANINSNAPTEVFSHIFVEVNKPDSYFVELSIFLDEQSPISHNGKRHFFRAGKTSTSLKSLFDQLNFTDSAQQSFYKLSAQLLPGSYTAKWSVGETSLSYYFKVNPKRFDQKVIRSIVNDGHDSIRISWTLDSSLMQEVNYRLRWKSASQDVTHFIENGTDTSLCVSLFLPDTKVVFWVEEYYGDYLTGSSAKQALIPNPANEITALQQSPDSVRGNSLKDSLLSLTPGVWAGLKENSRFYGSVGAEFFGTTNDYAHNFYGNSALSLYGSSGIESYGFPVKVNYLANWYQSTGLQLTDVSLELDFNRLRQNLEKQLRKEVESRKRELLSYPDLAGFDTLKGDQLQKRIQEIESDERYRQGKKIKKQASGFNLDSTKNQARRQVIDEKDGLLKQVGDSANYYKDGALDSMNRIKKKAENAGDGYYTQYQKETDSLNQLYNKLNQEYARFKKLESRYRDLKSKGIDLYNLEPANYQDPELLMRYLPDNVKRYGGLLMNIQKMEMGWSHAYFSDFSIANKAFHGLNLQYEGRQFSMAAIKGTTTNGFLNSGREPLNNTHSVNGLSLGIMKSENSQVSINYVDFRDRNAPLGLHDNNKVLAVVARQRLFSNLFVEAEVAQSYSRHALNTGLTVAGESAFASLFDISNTASQAYSAGLVFDAPKSASGYSIKLKRVGSGFVTLGNPFIYSDRMGVHFNMRQALLKNKVMLMAQYAREINNLSGQLNDTARFERLQLGVVASVFKKVNASVFYVPVKAQHPENNHLVHTLNASVDMNDKIGSVKTTLQLNYSMQLSIFQSDEIADQTTEVLSLNSLFISRRGNNLRLGASASTPGSTFQQRQATGSFQFKWSKRFQQELYANYYQTSLFGSKSLSGLGLNYRYSNTLQLQARLGYSYIIRPFANAASSGMDVSVRMNVSLN